MDELSKELPPINEELHALHMVSSENETSKKDTDSNHTSSRIRTHRESYGSSSRKSSTPSVYTGGISSSSMSTIVLPPLDKPPFNHGIGIDWDRDNDDDDEQRHSSSQQQSSTHSQKSPSPSRTNTNTIGVNVDISLRLEMNVSSHPVHNSNSDGNVLSISGKSDVSVANSINSINCSISQISSKVHQHTLSTHPLNTPCQYTLSMRPVNTLCQYTLPIHPVNTPSQYTLSTHLSTLSLCTNTYSLVAINPLMPF